MRKSKHYYQYYYYYHKHYYCYYPHRSCVWFTLGSHYVHGARSPQLGSAPRVVPG